MRLPLVPGSAMKMPWPLLAAMTLPAPGAVPPTRLFCDAPKSVRPSAPLEKASRPVMSVPM